MLRLFSSLGLFLWICVMGLQSAHEWSHHAAHHAVHEGNHAHCGHHHNPAQLSAHQGVALSVDDECALCDWDWLPAGSICTKALQISGQQWGQIWKAGAVEAGHGRNHCNQTKSHRGPPRRG